MSANAVAQSVDAQAAQTWSFSASNQTGTLALHDGIFSIAKNGDGIDNPVWTFAGSIKGFEIGKAGVYVGDLDGSGKTAVAFFEPRQRLWYFGTFSNTSLTFTSVEGEVFHVGEGPYLFPLDLQQVNENPDGRMDVTTSAKFAALVNEAVPAFPIRAQQYTKLATSRNMTTNVTVFADGLLSAVTQVHNGVWLAGYHGGVQVVLLDGNKKPLMSYAPARIGVTGTAFGSPDVTKGWQVQVTSNLVNATRYIAIYQQWDPDFTTFIRDIDPWLKFIQQLAQVVKLFIPSK